ncbi:MAG: adenylate/guanylate cyclase domain-containing protein [Chloroflexota bacterium]
MPAEPLYFRHQLTLKSTPEQLWNYVADTDRLNYDIGLAPVTIRAEGDLKNSRKPAQQTIQGFLLQKWTEDPFQWTRPYHYNTTRNYTQGIFHYIRQRLDMTPHAGGTDMDYQIWVMPRYGLLSPLINASFSGMDFPGVFRKYDDLIQNIEGTLTVAPFLELNEVTFVDGGRDRLNQLKDRLVGIGGDPILAERLVDYLSQADDLEAMSIRPYALADYWNAPRREVLETCLLATRAGLLDMRWELLCPLCRGAKATVDNLEDITATTHCEVCRIDYTANFEQSVELSFYPSAQIREITLTEYCVGGPENTPHIVVQQLLGAGDTRTVSGKLSEGRYRIRTLSLEGEQYLRVKHGTKERITLRASRIDGWGQNEPYLHPTADITLVNTTDEEQLFIVEHLIWSDQAVTAAEVTTRQVFRDLFASEALRPNEQIAISNLTFVFTDLRASTKMYREVGDAPAFGLVMEHFDVLREAIRAEDGAIVKTIGDAVMAVFQQPEKAVRAMIRARRHLEQPVGGKRVLNLRVGIHQGKAIAVTLNERLDYFGTTINIAARLEGQSDGTDIVISDVVYQDPKVQKLLDPVQKDLIAERYDTQLKGFDDEAFTLWRLRPQQSLQTEMLPSVSDLSD